MGIVATMEMYDSDLPERIHPIYAVSGQPSAAAFLGSVVISEIRTFFTQVDLSQ